MKADGGYCVADGRLTSHQVPHQHLSFFFGPDTAIVAIVNDVDVIVMTYLMSLVTVMVMMPALLMLSRLLLMLLVRLGMRCSCCYS